MKMIEFFFFFLIFAKHPIASKHFIHVVLNDVIDGTVTSNSNLKLESVNLFGFVGILP
jgi:hypothetical protein